MSDSTDDRRNNSWHLELMQELKRQGAVSKKQAEDCHEQNKQLAEVVGGIKVQQAVFMVGLDGIRLGLNDLTTTVTPMVAMNAVQNEKIRETEGDVKNLFGMVSEDRKEFRSYKTSPTRQATATLTSNVMAPESIKWIVIAVGIILVAVLLAAGSVSTAELKQLTGIAPSQDSGSD